MAEAAEEKPLVFTLRIRNWIYIGRGLVPVLIILFALVQMSLRYGFDPRMFFLSPVVLLLVWLGLRGVYEERVEIANGAVKFQRRGPVRWKSREEKLSDFIGVEAIMRQPPGNRSGQDYFAKYLIVMVHKHRDRSIILSGYTQGGRDMLKEFSGIVKGDYVKEMRFIQEQYARALGLPVMTTDPDSGNYTLRKVEDLNKSISELRKEGKKVAPRKITKYTGSQILLFRSSTLRS